MEKILKILLKKAIVSLDSLKRINFNLKKERNVINKLISSKVTSEKKIIDTISSAIKDGYLNMEDIEEFPGDLKEKILKSIAVKINIEFINLDSLDINLKLTEKVPLVQLKKYNVLPIREDALNIVVVFKNPFDITAQEAVQRLFPRKPIKLALSSAKQIEQYLNKLEITESIKGLIEEIRRDLAQGGFAQTNESSAILRLIELILKMAINSKASDIHIEPTENNCIVRNRVDGILTEAFIFDKDIYPPLSSRIKLLANLDIAEKRKPQDGRFSSVLNQKEYDFRISTLPITKGESIVMRILDKSKAMIKLEDAGMSIDNYEKFVKALKKPYGLILVTGPTGSGKSTTLYGALNMIRTVEKKIITVEDPVEYQMNLVQQSQVQPKIGFTFASALRSILRQDPDVIMVGEIRDQETLRIAIQAAQTGHLVLSTLHTNDAISSITRMLDMGIESYLLSGALLAIEAQRLVRKICPYCKESVSISLNIEEDLKEFLPSNYQFYRGKGCKNCNMSGYSGREMVSEVLLIDEILASMIAREEDKEAILKYAKSQGFVTLIEDGVKKALEGKTTIEEVLRVTRLT
jgi:general secretion pathway protein E